MTGIKSILPYHKPLAEEVRSNIFWCDGFMTIPNSSPRTEFLFHVRLASFYPHPVLMPVATESCPSIHFQCPAAITRRFASQNTQRSITLTLRLRLSPKVVGKYRALSIVGCFSFSWRSLSCTTTGIASAQSRVRPRVSANRRPTCRSAPLITQRLRGPHSHCFSWTCHISAEAEGQSDADTV